VLPGFFETAMACFSQHPDGGLVSGISRLMSEDGIDLGDFARPTWAERACWLSPAETTAALERHGSWFMGNATIYRRECLLAAGGFREDLGPFCDGFVSLVVALKYGSCFVPTPFGAWRRMESGYSATVGAIEERSRRITAKAAELMRSEFGALFSPRLARQVESNLRVQSRLLSLRQSYVRRQQQLLSRYRGRSPLHLVIGRSAHVVLWVEEAMLRCYYVLRFRRPLWPLLKRKFGNSMSALFKS